ncbi:hypothetical protein [Exiguobacterium sp. s192]|uniref:hypothetical protein n=1 Tax=Exiguobacterium sp. s192 TaxID=2751206 RepID=UPI001BEABA52|nr:hypothetical protein [Exiguobacterium sp. s192]
MAFLKDWQFKLKTFVAPVTKRDMVRMNHRLNVSNVTKNRANSITFSGKFDFWLNLFEEE